MVLRFARASRARGAPLLGGDEAEYTFALSVYFYLLRCKAKDN